MVKPACAQSIPTPSVPEFSLKLIPSLYKVTNTNPYTGVNNTQQIDNNTIDVVINNQPFAPYSNIQLYYNVQVKGHFENNEQWTQVTNFPTQSNSEYTILSVPANNYPAGSELDFRVEASIGYFTTVPYYPPGDTEIPYGTTQVFNGTESGWSNTQTLTIPASSTSPTPTVPEFPSWAIPLLFILTVTAGLSVCFKKYKRRQFG